MADQTADLEFPGQTTVDAASGSPASDVEEAAANTSPFGATLMSWDVPEFRRYARGRAWYAVAGVVAAGLLIYAVVSANFLFALIVLMFALVLYMTSVGEQRFVRFALTETGIVFGNAFYPYKDVSRFWVAYEPPTVQSLYMEFKGGFRQRMSVDLDGQNPNDVRGILTVYVREDLEEDGEPLSDTIGRILKI